MDAKQCMFSFIFFPFNFPLMFQSICLDSTMINENRASSFIRSGSKKVTTEKDLHMQLWQNYVILACSVAQKTSLSELTQRCSSPEPG